MTRRHIVLAIVAAILFAERPVAAGPADDPVDALLSEARSASRQQQPERAIELLSKAIEQAPGDNRAFRMRGDVLAALERHDDAVADYTAAIKLAPDEADLYDRRGSEQFKLGRIEASIDDFDRFLSLRPDQTPFHWKRGISYYYAGRFDDGRKQFEGYQTVDSNDVENAVWRYLCMARSLGVEKARAGLLPIKRDRRVPMMEIYAMFRGDATPEQVLRAARRADGTGDATNAPTREGEAPAEPARLNERLFYAQLYIGLFYEAAGDARKATEHIAAAEKHKIPHYMWDVARVHAHRLRAQGE